MNPNQMDTTLKTQINELGRIKHTYKRKRTNKEKLFSQTVTRLFS